MTNTLVQDAIKESKDQAKRRRAVIQRDSKLVKSIVNKLTAVGVNVQGVTLDSTSFNINVTGTKDDLAIVFGVMRREGLTPKWRPEEKQTSYASPWYADDEMTKVWLLFSSTTCKRVQVGTKTEEVPVYETVCEE